MTDRGIIMTGPMVRALLADSKTQTRRLAWSAKGKPTVWQRVKPWHSLWVRETFYETDKLARLGVLDGEPRPAVYRADLPKIEWRFAKWKSSRCMPRDLSRLTLVVTEVRRQRLQEISEEDAEFEGAVGIHCWDCSMGYDLNGSFHPDQKCDCGKTSGAEAFGRLWDHLHGAGSWDESPEVVVLTFVVHKANIDRIDEAA